MFLFGLLVSSVFFAHQPYAESASTPGSDGSMPKYVPQATKFRNLTPEEIVSYCNLVEADTKVTSVDAKSCSGRDGSNTGLRICQFKAMLSCNVNGYKGTTIRNGTCVGQKHDCGTFKYCVKNATKISCPKHLWLNAKKDSFKAEAAHPKATPW